MQDTEGRNIEMAEYRSRKKLSVHRIANTYVCKYYK